MALVDAPAPGTPGVMDATALAKRAYDEAVARSKQNVMSTLRGYGYNAEVGADGALANLRVDAANPSGQYQQMLRSHAVNDQSMRENAVGRGIHGGLAHQMQSDARYGYGQDAATLGQQVTGTVSGYADNLQQAAYQRDSTLWEAQQQAARDAIANQSFNPADFSGLSYPDYGGSPNADYSYTDPSYDDGSSSSVPTEAGIDNATRNKLIKQLYSRGVVLSSWAKAHPDEAAALGLGSGYGSNNQLLRQVYGGTPPKVNQTAKPAPKPTPSSGYVPVINKPAAPKPAPKPASKSVGKSVKKN